MALGPQLQILWEDQPGAVLTRPLLDADDNVYVCSQDGVRSYTAAGVVRWVHSMFAGQACRLTLAADGALVVKALQAEEAEGRRFADKAELLSASISIGMNCTAFGLMVAIPLVLVHSLLQTKTTELINSLETASVKFLNALNDRQQTRGQSRLALAQAANG